MNACEDLKIVRIIGIGTKEKIEKEKRKNSNESEFWSEKVSDLTYLLSLE